MTASITPHDPLVKRLHAIQKLITANQLPEAASKLNAAVKASPDDPRIYLLGSRLAEAAGNPQGAQDGAKRAVSLAPGWHVAVTEYASLLSRQNRFEEALAQATRAVSLAPDDLEVLTQVIDIAHRAQHTELALQWLARAAAIAPQNVTFRHLIATDLRYVGRYDESIAVYDGLLKALPDDRKALLGRAQAAYGKGDRARALQDCDLLLGMDPGNEEYKFLHALASGTTPPTQPVAVFKDVFDAAAPLFDQHLVRGLRYQLPKQVAELITNRYPGLKLNLLDLGCGTGLLGVCLGRIDGALIGVDISEKMIEQAIRHNVYDRFHQVNLLDALTETPDALYDVITALDVFIYSGDLTLAIPNSHRILVPGGHLIFSCETALEEEADLVLRPSMRYAHKRSHVESLCKAAGFADVSIEATDLRMENNEPVAAFIVVARKQA